MAQNQITTNSGQGNQNRKPNNGGNQGGNQSSKMMIKAYATVNANLNNTFVLMVEASAFLSGKPMNGQEATLREGIKTLDAQPLDVNGETMLKATGFLEDQEQIKVVRICLTGLPEEKNLTVTIPAIKKIVYRKKNIAIATASTVDSSANTAEIVFSCLVSEDTAICPNQKIALMKGAISVEEKMTDGNGRTTFVVVEPLAKTEKTVLYRVVLPGLTDEVEANAVIPAKESKKVDNDPEDLILSRYHDGCGKFVAAIRVLKAEGKGIKIPGKIFYKGRYHKFTTDDAGEHLFKVPGVIDEGNDFPLSATVSGIHDEARIKIKRRIKKPSFLEKKNWLITTNNGRGFLLLGVMLIIWLFIFTRALVISPLISPDLFRDHETGEGHHFGLSSAEVLFNKSANQVSKTLAIKPADMHSHIPSSLMFWLILYSIFSIIYAIASWREEVIDGIEDGIELIIDRDHGRASDPALEKWTKYFGISHKVKRAPVTVYSAPDPANPAPTTAPATQSAQDSGGHPSLGTLFELDLLSDTLVTIIPAILKKIFGK